MSKHTILVVDDEVSVRSYVGGILRRAGFDLLEASDGVEALQRAQQSKAVDLVVTDIRMPRMDGIALAKAIALKRPGMPIIYISGYPIEWTEFERPPRGCASLAKPFTRGALLDAVAKCLHRKPSAGAGEQ